MTALDFFYVFVLPFLYMIPTTLAAVRRNRNTFNVFIINVHLGWTVLGWLWAMNEALTDELRCKDSDV